MERLERRIEELKAELQHKVVELLEVVPYGKAPFTHLMLEMNVNRHQVHAILALMDEAKKSLSTSNPMNHGEFERRTYAVVPARDGDYKFAESIVGTLYDEGRYVEVAQHMAKSGMNPKTVLKEKPE